MQPQSRPLNPQGGTFLILPDPAAVRHTGPHTSAWPFALLTPAASLCVSGWQTAFRICAASHSVLALQAEWQFSCRPVDAMGANAPWKQGVTSFSAHRTCHVSHCGA